MKKKNKHEEIDLNAEIPCDKCGNIVKMEYITDVNGSKLCNDCFNKVPFRCCICHRMLTREQTSFWYVKDGMCCNECYEKTLQDRRKKTGYEEAEGYYEEYKCAECDTIVNTWDLKTYGGRKVCEQCYRELSTLDWLNNNLRQIRHEEAEERKKQQGAK